MSDKTDLLSHRILAILAEEGLSQTEIEICLACAIGFSMANSNKTKRTKPLDVRNVVNLCQLIDYTFQHAVEKRKHKPAKEK